MHTAENIIAAARDIGMNAIGGDEGHGRFLENGGSSATRGRVAARYGKFHAVLTDELVCRKHRFLGLGLIVIRNQIDFLPEHTAIGIDLLARHFGGDPRRNSVCRSRSRQRRLKSKLHLCGSGRSAREERAKWSRGRIAPQCRTPGQNDARDWP